MSFKRVATAFILCLSSFGTSPLWSDDNGKSLIFATYEYPPYAGEHIPQNGYVLELVKRAFEIEGFKVHYRFLPPARALIAARKGKLDGIVPVHMDEQLKHELAFSDPFPGDILGFLKKKSADITGYAHSGLTDTERLQALKPYYIGVLKDSEIEHRLKAENFNIVPVHSNLQNIDKLAMDRLNLIAIDKYTAADTLVNERPYLIGDFRFMRPALTLHDFYLGVSKNKPAFDQILQVFNRGLAALNASGELLKIQQAHGLYDIKNHGIKNLDQPSKQTLVIGTVNNHEMMVMQKLSSLFELQHPQVKIEWRVLDENTLRQRLMSDIAISDGQFDVMTIGAYEAQIWAKKSWITPLDSFNANYDVDDLLPSVRQALSYDGQLYALPFYAESSMVYYRQDLFKNKKLYMPDNPTYDEIERFAARLHDPKNELYGICLRGEPGWGGNMALISTMVNAYGGQWFNMNWQPAINTLEWENAVKKYKDLLTKYGPPHPELNGFNENLQLFAEGHCGLWIDATVAAGVLFNPDLSQVSGQVAVAHAPKAKTDKGSHWLWTWALAIPESSSKKELASEFIQWATSKEYIQQVADLEGWVAVPPGTRHSTYDNKEYQKAAPFSDFVLKSIKSADPVDATLNPKPYVGIQFVDIPEFASIGSQVGTLMVQVLEGDISIHEALEKSQISAAEQMLKSDFYMKKKLMKYKTRIPMDDR